MAVFRNKQALIKYLENGIENKEEIIGYMQKSKNVRYHEGMRDGLKIAMQILEAHVPNWEIKSSKEIV